MAGFDCNRHVGDFDPNSFVLQRMSSQRPQWPAIPFHDGRHEFGGKRQVRGRIVSLYTAVADKLGRPPLRHPAVFVNRERIPVPALCRNSPHVMSLGQQSSQDEEPVACVAPEPWVSLNNCMTEIADVPAAASASVAALAGYTDLDCQQAPAAGLEWSCWKTAWRAG